MSKSIMYAANTSVQDLGIGDAINFGSIVRRYGCNCNLSGGNPVVSGTGYYDVDTYVTFTAGAAGTVTVTLYANGVAITGANVSATVAADSTYDLGIGAIVRAYCNAPVAVTAVVSGVAGTVSNASVKVEKT